MTPRAGQPPLDLDFGVETSAEARALTRAADALQREPRRAGGRDLRPLPLAGGTDRLGLRRAGTRTGSRRCRQLAAAHPASSVALLHLGIADYWAGRNADAVAAWAEAAKVGADSPYGVKAEDLLHPTLNCPVCRPAVPRARLRPSPRSRAAARRAARRARPRRGEARRPGEAPVRLRALGPRAAALGRAAVRGRREARAARPGRAHGRGRRRCSRRRTRCRRSAGSGRSPASSRAPRSSASTSACSCSGAASGRRRSTQLRLAAADAPDSSYAQDARRLAFASAWY